MAETPRQQQGGAHDSSQDLIQHMIWRLESERDSIPSADRDAYDTLIQRWERVVLDTPLDDEAKELLEQMIYEDQWIFATPVDFEDVQYTADIPILPVHVSQIQKPVNGQEKRFLHFEEDPISTEKGGIGRAFEISVDDVEDPVLQRIAFTPPPEHKK